MHIILSQRIDLESDYEDIPFIRYHFPKRYRSQINSGDMFIYNQGNRYNEAHRYYFGCGKIGRIWEADQKDHYFAEIINSKRFSKKVGIKNENGKTYLESIDYDQVRNKENPPWQSAIRKISPAAFEKIISLADGYKIIDKGSVKELIIESLKSHGGSASLVTICKDIWKRYEMDLRKSGDFFYTWQYDIRWAATKLGDQQILKPAEDSPKGIWELIEN